MNNGHTGERGAAGRERERRARLSVLFPGVDVERQREREDHRKTLLFSL